MLGATESGARDRDVRVEAVRELIDIADRLLRDFSATANPALRFEKHVRNLLRDLAGRDRVIATPGRVGDFRVQNTIVEAKYVRPGTDPNVLVRRAARQLAKASNEGIRMIVVVNDDAGVEPTEIDGILVRRLADLTPVDLAVD